MSAFWDWAVAAYRDEAVRIACLDLQDAQGQNVPLLLWGAWCAASGRAPDEEALEAAMRELREEAGVVFDAARFQDLGEFDYRRDKGLHLFMVEPGPALESLAHLHPRGTHFVRPEQP